jgi:hypothetical protein
VANQQIAFITPTTSADTTAPFPTNMYSGIVVTSDALGVGETINIQVVAGNTPQQVLLMDGTSVATLTSALQGVVLQGGPSYIFVKSATASACGLYIDCLLK